MDIDLAGKEVVNLIFMRAAVFDGKSKVAFLSTNRVSGLRILISFIQCPTLRFVLKH